MIRLFVRHHVVDFQEWKRVHDAFESERRELGVRDHTVFTEVEEPTDVTVCHDFETIDTARSYLDEPRVQASMELAGVLGAPEHWLTRPAATELD